MVSPGSGKDTFGDIETFLKKVNAGPTISGRGNLPELRKNSAQIKQWYTESMEKYCELFDSLPRSQLETIFGSNIEAFLKVRVFQRKFTIMNQIFITIFSYSTAESMQAKP